MGANTFLRSLPIDHEEAEIRHLPNNTPITVLREVETSDGERWYQVNQEEYLKGSEVRIPTPPTTTFEGKWIDVELETPAIVTAYEGNRAVFSCLTIKGYAATPTRTGIYTILRRVADETMIARLSASRATPQVVTAKHVYLKEYFTSDGASFTTTINRLWVPGSHGCLG